MTAYGRATLQTKEGECTLEITSVNRKTLDIQCSLPRDLHTLEMPLRKLLSSRVQRGRISLRLSGGAFSSLAHTFHIPTLEKVKARLEDAASALGYDPTDCVDFETILSYAEELGVNDFSFVEKGLETLFSEAFTEFEAMRVDEGSALLEDIKQQLITIESANEKIKYLSDGATRRYRERLIERLREVSDRDVDVRIIQEVAIYAEKVDISEELARIDSHLKQFYQSLKESEKSLGKRLDFLSQEINRELNTLASKSSDIEITNATLDARGALERIREQLHNVE